MAKKKAKKQSKNGSDGLRIIDSQFGVSADAKALHEEFSEQAEVAEMLYAARKAAGLTQKQLAERAETTQQVISQLEDADYQGHSLSMLRRVACALGSQVEIRLSPIRRKRIRVN
jgi:DNA-binding XRE family transcriptional regulator